MTSSGRAGWAHLVYTASTLLPVLGGLVITPVLTRSLSSTEYGHVATAALVVQVGGLLFAFGAAAQLHLVSVEAGPATARGLLYTVLVAGGVLAAACAVGAAIAPARDVLGEVAPVALVGAAVAAGVSNCLVFLRALQRPIPYFAVSLVMSVIAPALALMGLSRLASTDWLHYVAFLYAGSLTALALALMMTAGPCHLDRPKIRSSLEVALPTVPHQMGLYAMPLALVWVAGALADPKFAGEVQLGLYVGSIVPLATAAINSAWTPLVLSTPATHRFETAERLARLVMPAVALLTCLVALITPLLSSFLAPANYDRRLITETAVVSCFGGCLTAVYYSNGHLVQAARATRSLAWATPLIGVVSMAGMTWLWTGVGLLPLSLAQVVLNASVAWWFHRISVRATGSAIGPAAYAYSFMLAAVACAAAWAMNTPDTPAGFHLALAATQLIATGLLVLILVRRAAVWRRYRASHG